VCLPTWKCSTNLHCIQLAVRCLIAHYTLCDWLIFIICAFFYCLFYKNTCKRVQNVERVINNGVPIYSLLFLSIFWSFFYYDMDPSSSVSISSSSSNRFVCALRNACNALRVPLLREQSLMPCRCSALGPEDSPETSSVVWCK